MKINEYKARLVDHLLDLKLQSFGGVLIVGPKSCGKTTTAKRKAKSYIEFQDEDNRENYIETAKTMPSRLLIGEKPRLFDEWQDAPKIWGAVRKSIDDENENGLYILTGSSSSIVDVPHTGTGRISTLKMYPMSLFESGESNGLVSLQSLFDGKEMDYVESTLSFDELVHAICRGGWPRSLLSNSKENRLLVAKDLFVQTYSVDISHIDGIKRNKIWAQTILKSYARNLCTLADTKTIFEDVVSNTGITKPTYYDYIEALNKLYIIEDVPAWCPSIRSKNNIRASSKRNLIDPSLAVAALSLSPSYFNSDLKTLGFLFESLCIRDLKVYSSKFNGEVSYYHDRFGLEADAVLHLEDGRYALIEIKLGTNEIEKAANNLCEIERLIDENNKNTHKLFINKPSLKIVLTGSQFGYKRQDGVYVIPIGCLKD